VLHAAVRRGSGERRNASVYARFTAGPACGTVGRARDTERRYGAVAAPRRIALVGCVSHVRRGRDGKGQKNRVVNTGKPCVGLFQDRRALGRDAGGCDRGLDGAARQGARRGADPRLPVRAAGTLNRNVADEALSPVDQRSARYYPNRSCKMSVTSSSCQLKKRIAALVVGSGRSAHAFMVEAIARETERAESFREFLQDAREAEDVVSRTGKAYDAKEVFAYLAAKAQGLGAERPRAKSGNGPLPRLPDSRARAQWRISSEYSNSLRNTIPPWRI
jgi:hypothetical protein